MTNQDMNAVIIAINEFAQGSPLPYTVLDATHQARYKAAGYLAQIHL